MEQFIQENLNLLILVAFFATISAVILVISIRHYLIQRRLVSRISDTGDFIKQQDIGDLKFEEKQSTEKLQSVVQVLFKQLSKNETQGARIRLKLIKAGIFNPHAVGYFMVSRILLALILPAIFAVLISMYSEDASIFVKAAMPILMSLIGLVLPDFYVSRRTSKLQLECTRGFPDFLDLLVVATDAGLSLEAAMNRVGNSVINTYPSLGANVQLMTLEMRAGREFSEALDGLVDRIGIDDIRSFATLLQQSRELGSSVTQALRVYSEDMRHKRMSLAEEKAHALPVKLTIPLGIFLFPVMILVALLPVALRIRQAFFSD